MGLGKKLKKIVKKVAPAAINPIWAATGLGKGVTGLLKSPKAPSPGDPGGDMGLFNQYASEEELRRQQLADQQKQQILDFGVDYENKAKDYRTKLAQSLAQTGQETFQRANPFILEDLNSRGLASSATTVGSAQADALKDIALQNQQALQGFDTDTYNALQDIRGSALSQHLGGNQDALDAALEMRRGGLERRFNVADQNRQMDMSKYIAKRQSRDNIIGGLIGLGGSFLGGGKKPT